MRFWLEQAEAKTRALALATRKPMSIQHTARGCSHGRQQCSTVPGPAMAPSFPGTRTRRLLSTGAGSIVHIRDRIQNSITLFVRASVVGIDRRL
jgi:hypothetical protein